MSLESVQCPGCGASVAFEGRRELFCSYCGAKLRVKTGASGYPMAVLDGIKEDTSLLVRRSAYGHLEKEVEGLLAEREGLREQWRDLKATDAQRRQGCTIIALGLFVLAVASISAGTTESLPGYVALGIAVGVAAIGAMGSGWRGQDKGSRERAEARGAIEQRMAELDGVITEHRERMRGLEADIERSIGEL